LEKTSQSGHQKFQMPDVDRELGGIPETSVVNPNGRDGGDNRALQEAAAAFGDAVLYRIANQCLPVLLCASFALMVQASQYCGDLNKNGKVDLPGFQMYTEKSDAPCSTHVVQASDTCFLIAQSYHTNLAFITLNGGPCPDILSIGDAVVVCLAKKSTCKNVFSGMIPYAVSVGAISCILCVMWMFASKYSPRSMAGYKQQNSAQQKLMLPFAIFLAIWWSIAAAILTFDKPFTFTGNGYFSAWMGAIASNIFLSQSLSIAQHTTSAEQLRAQVQRLSHLQPVFLLFLSSVIAMIAGADVCDRQGDNCTGEYAWAFAVGALSLVLTVVVIILEFFSAKLAYMSVTIVRGISVLLLLLWVPGVYVLTFVSPWTETSNGYFAAWICLFLSAVFAEGVWGDWYQQGLRGEQKDGGGSNDGAGTGAGGDRRTSFFFYKGHAATFQTNPAMEARGGSGSNSNLPPPPQNGEGVYKTKEGPMETL
jgi:hypothetical protein